MKVFSETKILLIVYIHMCTYLSIYIYLYIYIYVRANLLHCQHFCVFVTNSPLFSLVRVFFNAYSMGIIKKINNWKRHTPFHVLQIK